MKKKTLQKLLLMSLLVFGGLTQVRAQYMPVVFDKKYGNDVKVEQATQVGQDGLALLSHDGSGYTLTWLDRTGTVIYSKALTGYSHISSIQPEGLNQLLVVGQSATQNSNRHSHLTQAGRATVLNQLGAIVKDVTISTQGSYVEKGQLLKDGSLLLAGKEPRGNSWQGMFVKIDKDGREIYHYKNPNAAYCNQFVSYDNLSSGQYTCAVFSGQTDAQKTFVVRIDGRGRIGFITPLPVGQFQVSQFVANQANHDGSMLLAGSSPAGGSQLYKLRAEGDIVFSKTIIPAGHSLSQIIDLEVFNNGNIVIAGNDQGHGYYNLLRNDGTALYSGLCNGKVAGLGINNINGQTMVSTYDSHLHNGNLLRIQSTGKSDFNRIVNTTYDKINIDNDGKIDLLSTAQGRISTYSSYGQLEFDRYITDNRPTQYTRVFTPNSGDIIFLGQGNRVVKLGHGLYVSDIQISKPLHGTVRAGFTITLTGYSLSLDGVPVPVSVDYASVSHTAQAGSNYAPVQGRLSFNPTGLSDRYLVKQYVEVPIKANNLVEGVKDFLLKLSHVKNSYLLKSEGKCIINDQKAIVSLVHTQSGQEGSKDIVYQLGLFKTDGTPLVNSTGANIIIDGQYGQGTADALDYDMSIKPRIIIAQGQSTADFHVKTLEDARYELPKNVVVDFNKIYSLSNTDVSFNGEMLSCNGTVIDQPAKIEISSLGDHLSNENVVSGFFTISLVRASDGALETNNTGSDLSISCSLAKESTAQEGKDFVFTNNHGILISGEGMRSSVNVNGLILFSKDPQDKQVKVKLDSVTQPAGAQQVAIAVDKGSAQFTIRK